MPRPIATVLFALALITGAAASAQPQNPHVLFIRGAERSGGFLEAKDDAGRTEQLADITNTSTDRGNHGWATLAATLREAGFTVSQVTEPLEPDAPSIGQTQGAPLPLEEMDLDSYDVIVFGSNNARYEQAAVDAVEQYLRNGGGAIFISDANFGSDWADASESDQPFLDRLGLTANQDRGTYALSREAGEFVVADHPILDGVGSFDGEGVTPVTVGDDLPADVEVQILANAKNTVRRNPEAGAPAGPKSRRGGPGTKPTEADAALLAGTIGQGRFVAYFDRNTFFNQGGAGADITRHDNRRFAINLFRWTAGD